MGEESGMPDIRSAGSPPQSSSPAGATSPRERLDELFAKVDAFFARARARHGESITCHAGCDDCCRRRFSVTALEADAIREHLAALPHADREALARRAIEGDPSACPALGPGGRCGIYAARPLICRTHGLPIRFAPAPSPGARSLSLPMIDACPKNFAGEDLRAIEAVSVLDQGTLSTVLGALDAAYADSLGRPRGERITIVALLEHTDFY
jgi:uncharacterized protein